MNTEPLEEVLRKEPESFSSWSEENLNDLKGKIREAQAAAAESAAVSAPSTAPKVFDYLYSALFFLSEYFVVFKRKQLLRGLFALLPLLLAGLEVGT